MLANFLISRKYKIIYRENKIHMQKIKFDLKHFIYVNK